MTSAITRLEYQFLKAFWPKEPDHCNGSVYRNKSKLEVLLGPEFLRWVAGKTVIEFGCGRGAEAIELAQRGASRVVGIDIREQYLEAARESAISAGVADRCLFTTCAEEGADLVVSIDSFEHFADPAEILRIMNRLLVRNGKVFLSFGPTWYHPLGGHLFSVFPWAHLILREEALIRWRAQFKSDGATRFDEVAGGLNQMTIRRFETLVEASPFQAQTLELVPIRRLKLLHGRLTREFTTAFVRARLVKKAAEPQRKVMRAA
jgi:SAM-dependent methyltransferase